MLNLMEEVFAEFRVTTHDQKMSAVYRTLGREASDKPIREHDPTVLAEAKRLYWQIVGKREAETIEDKRVRFACALHEFKYFFLPAYLVWKGIIEFNPYCENCSTRIAHKYCSIFPERVGAASIQLELKKLLRIYQKGVTDGRQKANDILRNVSKALTEKWDNFVSPETQLVYQYWVRRLSNNFDRIIFCEVVKNWQAEGADIIANLARDLEICQRESKTVKNTSDLELSLIWEAYDSVNWRQVAERLLEQFSY